MVRAGPILDAPRLFSTSNSPAMARASAGVRTTEALNDVAAMSTSGGSSGQVEGVGGVFA